MKPIEGRGLMGLILMKLLGDYNAALQMTDDIEVIATKLGYVITVEKD